MHPTNQNRGRAAASEAQSWHARRVAIVSELAGPIAQDCANLLTTIRAGCDLLAGELGGTPHREDLEAIARSADNAAALLRQLVALASTEAVQARLIALDDLVAGFERVLRRLLGDAVPLRVDLGHAGFIHADASAIEHVILGVVLAARETVAGGAQLWLATERVVVEQLEEAADEDGVGIPAGVYASASIALPGHPRDVETAVDVGDRAFRTSVGTAAAMVHHTGGYVREWVTEDGVTIELLFPSCLVSSEAPRRPRVARRRGRRGSAARGGERPSGPTAA